MPSQHTLQTANADTAPSVESGNPVTTDHKSVIKWPILETQEGCLISSGR